MIEPVTVAELQARITTAWGVYMNQVARLSPSQIEAPDPDGWTPRDQVAHVAAWERVVLAILNGEPRAAALGITDEQYAGGTDAINELLRQRSASRPWPEVLDEAEQTHAAVVERVAALGDDDLHRDFASFSPADAGEDGGDPILNWLRWDTYEHYDEHGEALARIVEQGGSR